MKFAGLGAICLACSVLAGQELGLHSVLARPILGPNQATLEVQVYTAARVPHLARPQTAADWEREAERLRRDLLHKVILRGEAVRWHEAASRTEWLETIEGDGYRIRKLRFEALPGLWIPALLYEPAKLEGRVPVILNVNGHEATGTATHYIQARCINLAKRGMLALNPEWVGRGQLNLPDFQHYRANQLDLCGTSGVSVHYLALKRAMDLILSLEHTDPERVAVTGLSGGAWQTILISALDSRVRLANPVAGYSSYVTRAQFPTLDLGDSEQTPTDLATVADYTHLTAMLAPRPALLTYNSRDTCCFRADYAVSPLIMAARPVYDLFQAGQRLRYHINYDAGHNYGRDNREAFYRFLRDHFFAGGEQFQVADIPVEDQMREAEQLRVKLPEDNQNFHSLALALSKSLPKDAALPAETARRSLREIVRAKDFAVRAEPEGSSKLAGREDLTASYWRLIMNEVWTVPAVEVAPGSPRSSTLLLADGGRATLVSEAERRLVAGDRVVALDPFYFGESRIDPRDFLFALLVAALGDRPLGLQASQLAAAARWLERRSRVPVNIAAIGPRTSLVALIAAALEPRAIQSVEVHDSFGSLKEIIERNLGANQAPELFCFGLLQAFDIRNIVTMIAPRRVTFVHPSARVAMELKGVSNYVASRTQ